MAKLRPQTAAVLDDTVVSDWCGRSLGTCVARVLFRSGHLAQVIGAELADGRSVVIKVRPFEPRVAGCAAVQAYLAAAGFPCPLPLAGPAASVPSLTPSPPWTGWDHPAARLWPDRDDQGRDLNESPGPGWVDRAAGRVRQRMSACHEPLRIGHGDWESQNIRWAGDRTLAVHDWDSVIARPEVAIAGLAAAVWPAAGEPGQAATVEQSADFITCYQAAAGARWTGPQIEHAWAAGLWVRLFNAKKDAASGGGPQLDRLAGEIDDRLTLAGLNRDR